MNLIRRGFLRSALFGGVASANLAPIVVAAKTPPPELTHTEQVLYDSLKHAAALPREVSIPPHLISIEFHTTRTWTFNFVYYHGHQKHESRQCPKGFLMPCEHYIAVTVPEFPLDFDREKLNKMLGYEVFPPLTWPSPGGV